MHVDAGDVVTMEGYAYFEGGNGYSSTASLTSFVAAVAGTYGGASSGTEAQQATYDAFDNAFGVIGMQGTGNDNVPAAYLNYILFDRNMVYKRSGFKQVSGAGNFAKEHVVFGDDIEIEEAGFIYCYVSMESINGRVFWDDFQVSVVQSEVVQVNNYYPFGLTFNSYQRVTAEPNKFLFNGIEREMELDLGWDLAQFRSYDATIGRWHQIDPKVSERESPYVGFANNPIFYVDPLGDTIINNNNALANLVNDVNAQIGALNQFINDDNTNYSALGVTKEQMQAKVSSLNGVLGEINVMKDSEQVYNIMDEGVGGAGISWNSETGAVDIAINEDASIGLIGHEILHGFQFESGAISIKTDNSGYGALYDIGDETAGYERERMLDGGIGSIRVPPRTDAWTRQHGSTMTPPAYQGLPVGPINTNSKQGLNLRLQVIRQTFYNKTITEVFKGYR